MSHVKGLIKTLLCLCRYKTLKHLSLRITKLSLNKIIELDKVRLEGNEVGAVVVNLAQYFESKKLRFS